MVATARAGGGTVQDASATKIEAIYRRRMARQLKSSRRREREKRERDVVIRLTARALRRGYVLSLIQLDARFWQLRSCGWDVLTEEYARDDAGEPCDPGESSVWRWWVSLHWKSREQLRAASLFARHHS